MPEVHFDRYYRYDDLTKILKAFAEEYPKLVKLDSIGQSHEGRDIWIATVTNFETGPDTEKPAFWVDGNIHATEVSPSSVCLYLINRLTSQYGKEEDVTRCLDTRAFYVVPRLNPDGAEWALADKPKFVRSSTRPYPFNEDPIEGLMMEDMDGDGRLLQMRIPDPNGTWKPHPEDSRLLIRRDPIETGGTYYRLFPEGRIENYDGVTLHVKPHKEGLDLNRNYPIDWRQEFEQSGAGPYPTSEPEIHAAVQFITSHTNITGAAAFHTFSGVFLRPYTNKDDKEFPAEDLWTYKTIGEKATEITGYPAISTYHEFRYHPNSVITGTSDSWMYDHQGVFGWVVEVWSPQRQAGIEDYKYIDWFRDHPPEDDLKLLKWSDEKLDGKGYVDWYEYDHPQLGKIELGGWNSALAFRNPPPEYLEAEIAPFSDWLLWALLISPRLEVYEASATPVGEGAYRVRMVVNNSGWLPSYVTKKAAEKKIIRGVICEIELPEGADLETGKAREEFGQLEGRAYKTAMYFGFPNDSTTDRLKVEWVVKAPEGGTVKLLARHDRAGTVRAEVQLA